MSLRVHKRFTASFFDAAAKPRFSGYANAGKGAAMKSTILTLLAVSLVLALFTVPANAAPFVYAVTGSQQFGTVDLANGHFQSIGSGTPDALSNLVWWHGSLLSLAYTGSDAGDLVKMDPSTGTETVIGQTGLGFSAFQLAQVRGQLYLTDFSGNLYSVNAESGVATPTAATGLPPDPEIPDSYNSDGSINLCDEAVYGIAGALYANFDAFATGPNDPFPIAPNDPTGRAHQWVAPPHLYRIDPFTGATTVVAKTDFQILSIVEVDGQVYAFEGVLEGWNSDISFPIVQVELSRLNLDTGATQKIANVADPSIFGIFGAAPVKGIH
jgi:hypothetical protein